MLEAGTFLGSRFEIIRPLGAGGMGVVYEALDRKLNHRLALKTLMCADAGPLYHLKNEFRSLADVVHPNLVGLYELVSDGDIWFFTMELIDGCSFTEHIWGRLGVFDPTATACGLPDTTGSGSMPEASALKLDQDRVVDAFQQFAHGVDAIHSAGKLHRDLKPSNVLVRRDGRVKIVDFGLAADQALGSVGNTMSRNFAGTPAYMAPEQARAAPATIASDWYAFGTMLYEVITGRVPFIGAVGDILVQKQTSAPPTPTAAAPLPELHELCMRLLAQDPKERPTGAEVLRQLNVRIGRTVSLALSSDLLRGRSAEAPSVFVGRDAELSTLLTALDDTETEGVVVVRLSGVSGVGKSTLVDRFAEAALSRCGAVVLRARCHERESLPFKGVDGIVDGLTRHLRVQPPLEAARVLPRDIRALARVFPVLNRLDAVAGVRQRRQLPQDPAELRRRATAAFAELLGKLSDTAPLVVCVDDFQWADVDSAAWFREVLTLPDAPACLFVVVQRSDQRDSAPVRTLCDGLEEAGIRPRALELLGLSPEAVAELSRARRCSDATSARLFEESRGNPFLVGELLREGGVDSDAATDLDGAIRARVGRLEDAPRRLLELLSLVGRPTEATVLRAALGIEDDLSPLAVLRADGFIRDAGGGRIEPYHDRIREAVVEGLGPATLSDLHGRIAPVLEERQAEPEVLVEHFLGAGHGDKALQYALLAAERATEALAFQRAAHFLGLATSLLPPERRDEIGGLNRRRADALARAGRCLEASEAYADAASRASTGEAANLQALCAAQKFLAGYVHEGIQGFLASLEALGVPIPRDPGEQSNQAFALITKTRGMQERFLQEPGWRTEAELPSEARMRLDLLWATWLGLNGFDQSPLVTLIGCLYTQAALEAREPNHCVAAAYDQIAYASIFERAEPASSAALLEIAAPLARPGWGAALRELAAGTQAHFGRDTTAAAGHFERAMAIFDTDCPGRTRERSAAAFYLVGTLWAAGRAQEAAAIADRERHGARERGDFFSDLYMTIYSLSEQMRDRPDFARATLQQALARLDVVVGEGPSRAYVGVARMIASWRQADVELYAGQPWAAVAILKQHQAEWGHSPLMQLPVHVNIHHALELRARTAIAMRSGATQDDIDAARGLAVDLIESAGPDGVGFGYVGLAALAVGSDQPSDAVVHLHRALGILDPVGPTFGPCLRMHIGKLQGGSEGKRIHRDAELALRAEGIVNPQRWAACWTFPFS